MSETPAPLNFAGRLRGNAAFLASNFAALSPEEAQVIVRALESAADHVEAYLSARSPEANLEPEWWLCESDEECLNSDERVRFVPTKREADEHAEEGYSITPLYAGLK